MRTHVKKRRYRQHVGEMAKTFCTDVSGIWVNESQSGASKASIKNGTHGAKCNKKAQDCRPRKGGKVHWTKSSQSQE